MLRLKKSTWSAFLTLSHIEIVPSSMGRQNFCPMFLRALLGALPPKGKPLCLLVVKNGQHRPEWLHIEGADFTIKNIPRSIKLIDPEIDINCNFWDFDSNLTL
jgi:hypothetical protein